jgi:guanyl-specific ribonuclease Sa
VPSKAEQALEAYDEGVARAGYKRGSTFANDGRAGSEILPGADGAGNLVTYQEWDVDPLQKGVNRGSQRIVTGSDGSAYWTDDHYTTFTRIR